MRRPLLVLLGLSSFATVAEARPLPDATETRPILQLLLQRGFCPLGLQAERVSGEVDSIFSVVLRDKEFTAEGTERILCVPLAGGGYGIFGKRHGVLRM